MLAPTLIVGLGGKGSDIVARVAKMVTKEQRSKIGFVVFDTDVNELREIGNNNPFMKTVQTSTKLSVGEYLNIDTHARDNWFPVNKILCRKTLTEGAGQVRAISRLALDTAIRAGNMEPLHEAIEELYKLNGEQMDQSLRIIIVSSLAGGTGSGLILPVALYIKNFLQIRFQQSANITRGFFILPEVFYEVIKGQAERNNLKCNAYATIRELDAFLMKGDGTLPEKYMSKLKFEFPRVASSECEEYDVMPFDFCFLFDAQNIDGKKLNSFNQYLDHAANCIYAQSIGPMNKRSNSSEDNTIRELCKSKGRNRYAGAGSSMLIYPYEDIREYIALHWADQCVSDQWLVFDKQFKEKSIQNNEMRSKGFNVKDLDPARDYISSLESAGDQKNAFASTLRNMCTRFDEDGLTQIGYKWEDYVGNLKAYIKKVSESGQMDLDQQKQRTQNQLSELHESIETDLYVEVYGELSKYKNMVIKRIEENARTIAYTMFKSENATVTNDKLDYQIETYMRDGMGNFVHPNAVRYFLYQTLYTLRQEKDATDRINEKNMKYFSGFEKNTFDDARTDSKEETVDDLRDKKISLINKITKKPEGWQHDLQDQYSNYLKVVNEYRVSATYAEVLNEAISYVKNMCDAFQIFYNSFEANVRSIKRSIEKMTEKYEGLKGSTTRYVCASRKCLKKFSSLMPFTGSAISLSSDLCDGIYSKVRQYSMMKEKPNETYFKNLFDEGIMGYFRDSVMESYSTEIKMDVIGALEKEAQYDQEEFDSDKIDLYVKKCIHETKHLSEPFIEKPLGEQKTIISSNAFNPHLIQAENPKRKYLVESELQNAGGCPDEDIGENMILFYKAIYGLRANELSKFAPAASNATVSRDGGEYYKAYFELVSQIKPKSQETSVITPHIDREWHLISQLPDLDEASQIKQESEIFKAFLLGLLFNKIQYKRISENKTWYRLLLPGCNAEDFVVSNKTPCDSFYEVLDALMINPLVVKGVIQAVDNEIERQCLSCRKIVFEKSIFVERLNNFNLPELGEISEKFKDKQMSVFDIVTFLKASTPTEVFRDEDGSSLIKVILDVVYNSMVKLCPPNELNPMFGELIMNQYAIFKDHIEIYDEEWPLSFTSYIDTVLIILYDNLIEKELDVYANIILADMNKMDYAKREKLRKS